MQQELLKKALFANFTQNQELEEYLLKTDNAFLVFRVDYDNVLGDGKDGKGQNLLGVLLMELRELLK